MIWYVSLTRKWRKWRRLSAGERRLLGQAWCLLAVTTVGLRILGFRGTHALLTRLAPMTPGAAYGDEEVTRSVSRATDAITRAVGGGPLSASCLPKALVLWWLLRRRGIETELRVGVRRRDGRLEAHAWVEYRGLPLTASGDGRGRFVPFPRALTHTPVKAE